MFRSSVFWGGFCHRIKNKKGNCDYLTIQTFFIGSLSYNFDLISHNFEFIYLAIARENKYILDII